MAFVKLPSNASEETEYNESKEKVTGQYISRFKDGWREFEDDGEEYLTEDDTVASDIDLLGKGSLYQLISVPYPLVRGRKLLADRLKSPYLPLAEVERRSKAVSELAGKRVQPWSLSLRE